MNNPPPVRTPNTQGQETRTRMLDALWNLIYTTPWENISAVDVTDLAGMSSAAFYYHFPHGMKEAVFALAERDKDLGMRLPDHLRIVLLLLRFEKAHFPPAAREHVAPRRRTGNA